MYQRSRLVYGFPRHMWSFGLLVLVRASRPIVVCLLMEGDVCVIVLESCALVTKVVEFRRLVLKEL